MSAWDEYVNSRPAPPVDDAARPASAPEPLAVVNGQWSIPGVAAASGAPITQKSASLQALPVGSESVPGKSGVWRYFVEADSEVAPF